MKKKINIEVVIDPLFKWIAVQPWGEVIAFTHKPKVFIDWSEDESGRVGYWEVTKGKEITLTQAGDQSENWKQSARRI